MSELLVLAEEIAREAHAGQAYNNRGDYLTAHVEPIVQLIGRMGYSEPYRAAGWLHDVVEDSQLTLADLSGRGIPLNVCRAVHLLTKRPNQSREAYLDRIATNGLAIVAKFADSSFNYANTLLNMATMEPGHFDFRFKKYSANIAFLHPLLPPVG